MIIQDFIVQVNDFERVDRGLESRDLYSILAILGVIKGDE